MWPTPLSDSTVKICRWNAQKKSAKSAARTDQTDVSVPITFWHFRCVKKCREYEQEKVSKSIGFILKNTKKHKKCTKSVGNNTKNTNLDFSDRVPVGYWTLLSHQEVRETDRARSGAGQNGAGQNWTGQKWSRPEWSRPELEPFWPAPLPALSVCLSVSLLSWLLSSVQVPTEILSEKYGFVFCIISNTFWIFLVFVYINPTLLDTLGVSKNAGNMSKKKCQQVLGLNKKYKKHKKYKKCCK